LGNFSDCLNKAVEAGKINKETAEGMLRESEFTSVEDALNNHAFKLAQKKREGIIMALRTNELHKRAMDHVKNNVKGGYVNGLMSAMVRDIRGHEKGFNVDYLSRIYQSDYHALMAEMLSRFRTRRVGFSQDTKGLIDFVKAVYGETIEDVEVSNYAQNYFKLNEVMIKNFNKAGGNIIAKKDWNLPQPHNRQLVQNASEDEWVNYVMPLMDRDKMIDANGNILNDEQLEQALRFSYNSIVTDGLNKVKDLELVPKGLGNVLASKHSESRFLHFKDAESWIEYNENFGSGDIFSTINSHIEMMAHDTALMDIFGTNPQLLFETMLRQAEKEGATKRQIKALSDQWSVVSGKVNNKVIPTTADFNQGIRNAITASTLGSAILSAMSDTAFSAITSAYRGLNLPSVYQNQIKMLNPSNEQDRILAVQMGLVADSWTGMATSANRYGETYGIGWSSKVSESVMRFSGLAPWTDAGRKAFGMEFGAAIAKEFTKSFDQLSPQIKKSFEDYGVNSDDWNSFRKTPLLKHKGAIFADFTKDKSKKLQNMVLTETDFAVPTPDARTRRFQTQGLEAGTAVGEITRHIMSLKSFPITLVATHGYRMANMHGKANKAAYGSALIMSTTLMGGLVIQLKDIAAGREPRDIGDNAQDRAKFWAAAMQQGGGLGIFGDFIFSDVNRFGGGIVQTTLGPVPELVDKSFKLTFGNVQELAKGEDTDFLPELGEFAKRYSPKTWQTKLLNDALYDQAILWADPSAQRRFNRAMKKRTSEYGQEFWWRKGELTPEVLQ